MGSLTPIYEMGTLLPESKGLVSMVSHHCLPILLVFNTRGFQFRALKSTILVELMETITEDMLETHLK
jgi:hypothetical protein